MGFKESETVELKKSLTALKEGLISISAILNKNGAGELWFGIAPNGKPEGLVVNEKTLRDISQSIAAHIEPRIYPQITEEEHKDKTCVKISFSGKEKPYFAYGRAYMRVADEDRHLTAKELENLILARNREAIRWDNQPCKSSFKDLSDKKIKAFVKRAGLNWDNVSNVMEKLGLIKDGQLLNAALPCSFLPGNRLCRCGAPYLPRRTRPPSSTGTTLPAIFWNSSKKLKNTSLKIFTSA